MKKFLMMLILLAIVCLSAAAADGTGIPGLLFPDYTGTDPQENPGPAQTGDSAGAEEARRVFPVSAATAVQAENENARPVVFRTEGDSEPVQAYVICDDTAHLRLEAAASDNPAAMICCDYRLNVSLALHDLLDPQDGAYGYDSPMPGADEGRHYTCVGLTDSRSGQSLAAVYLIAGEEYIEELAEDMRSLGCAVSWAYTEPAPEVQTGPEAYILHIADQDGLPVPGVIANFCTDTTCTTCLSDDSGTVTFSGAPGIYHIQLLRVPEGYSTDPGFEMYTGNVYSEWVLYIRRD